MCANYEPLLNSPKLQQHFKLALPEVVFKPEMYPGYYSPLVRLNHESGQRELAAACFGLLPVFAKTKTYSKYTYNARAETAHKLPSFRSAWRKHQFAIVPMSAFYEPNYASGSPVRWRIERVDREPFGVAALWDWWPGNAAEEARLSLALLTINADGHPLMQQFHKPADEKRSIVLLAPHDYDNWLLATPEQANHFLHLFEAGDYTAVAAPKARTTTPDAK